MMQLDKLNAPIKDNHIELNLKDPKDLAAGAAAVGAMGYAVYDNVKARRKRNQVRSSLAALEAKNNFLQQRVELTNRLNAWEKRSRVSHRVVRTMGNRITNIHKGAIAAFAPSYAFAIGLATYAAGGKFKARSPTCLA